MNINEFWALEHSQYSEDKGMYPWHIGILSETVEKNLVDCQHNNRKENKWQIVFIGESFESCQQICEALQTTKNDTLVTEVTTVTEVTDF